MSQSIIFALLSALAASCVAIFGKIGLKGVDSTTATIVRSVFMSGFLVVSGVFMQKLGGISDLNKKDILFIALSGISGALSWLFYFYAVKNGTVTQVVAIDKLSVVFAIILAAIFLGEAFTIKTALGAILIAGGVLFIAL